MQLVKISRELEFGAVVFFGRLGEINDVINLRLKHSSQGPLKYPDKPYFIEARYTWNADGVVVNSVDLRVTMNSKKTYRFFERECLEGEIIMKDIPRFRQFYLHRDGVAVWELARLIAELEDRHDLRELVRRGSDAIPVIDENDNEPNEDDHFQELADDMDLEEANLSID